MPGITIIIGHYGTGKTNIAINLAKKSADAGVRTCVCDLDIVNPYFRTADSEKLLNDWGIKLLKPIFANTNLDIPSLPPEIDSLFMPDAPASLLDVGGDDAGTVVLGRYRNKILQNGYQMYCVVSHYRPMIATPEEAVENLRELEAVCGIAATGIINNSSLGSDTRLKDIEDSLEYADDVCRLSGLPLIYTAVREDLFPVTPKLQGKNPLSIKLYTKTYW